MLYSDCDPGGLRGFPVLPVVDDNRQLSIFVIDADSGPAFLPLFFPADFLDFAGTFFVIGGALDLGFFAPGFGIFDCGDDSGLTEEQMRKGKKMRRQAVLFPELDELLMTKPLSAVWAAGARAKREGLRRWNENAHIHGGGDNRSHAVHDNNRGGDSIQAGAAALSADKPGAQFRRKCQA